MVELLPAGLRWGSRAKGLPGGLLLRVCSIQVWCGWLGWFGANGSSTFIVCVEIPLRVSPVRTAMASSGVQRG